MAQSQSELSTEKCNLDTLATSVTLQVISYNVTHSDLSALKRVNKQFYEMLNPNEPMVNKLWENVARSKYPLIPQRLKCKRWDLYYKYRFQQIQHANKHNYEHQDFRSAVSSKEAPFANVIENCDFDMNAINEQYHDRIIRKKSEYGDLKEDEIFRGEIGSNGLPKGFNQQLKCPMVFAGNTQFLDYVNSGIYSCKHCKEKVHTVTTLDEMKNRLKEKKCVRIVYYDESKVMLKDLKFEFMGKTMERSISIEAPEKVLGHFELDD